MRVQDMSKLGEAIDIVVWNNDYQVFQKFEKWLSKISYKPNWDFEARFNGGPTSYWIELVISTDVEVPGPEIRLRFGSTHIIPIEILRSVDVDLDVVGWLAVKGEIRNIEIAIRDKWLKYDGELVV